MVSKLDYQTDTSEFESHWVPLSYGLVPHLNKMLSKLQPLSGLGYQNSSYSDGCLLR